MADKRTAYRVSRHGVTYTLGSWLYELRQMKGWSQSMLAERLAVTNAYISHLEADRRTPSLPLLRRYARVCGTPFAIEV
jgi:transcriptional regulator with XRE-family HTH domain